MVRFGLDELRVDPHPVADPLHTSFQDMSYPEFTPDILCIPIRPRLVSHHGGAADDFQAAQLCEIRQNLVLHAVGEVSIGFIIAQIRKWKNRDTFVGD